MDAFFFLNVAAIAMTMVLAWLVVAYFDSKPPLQRTLVDLINSDLLIWFAATRLPTLALSIITFLHLNLKIEVPDEVSFPAALLSQFCVQANIIYTMWNVVVRYSYVYNKRMVLEDFSDEDLRRMLRGLTSLLSGVLCLLTYNMGFRPAQYLALGGEQSTARHRKSEVIYIILTTISVAINFVLTMAMRRHTANLGSHPNEYEAKEKVSTMKKIGAISAFVVILGLARRVTDAFFKSPFVIPFFILTFFNGVIVFYIVNKKPLRKFAKSKLEAVGVNFPCCENSVYPMS